MSRNALASADLEQFDVFDCRQIREIQFSADGQPIRRAARVAADLVNRLSGDTETAWSSLRASQGKLNKAYARYQEALDTASTSNEPQGAALDALIAAGQQYQRLMARMDIGEDLEKLRQLRDVSKQTHKQAVEEGE